MRYFKFLVYKHSKEEIYKKTTAINLRFIIVRITIFIIIITMLKRTTITTKIKITIIIAIIKIIILEQYC